MLEKGYTAEIINSKEMHLLTCQMIANEMIGVVLQFVKQNNAGLMRKQAPSFSQTLGLTL
jgi:hypothetical protein